MGLQERPHSGDRAGVRAPGRGATHQCLLSSQRLGAPSLLHLHLAPESPAILSASGSGSVPRPRPGRRPDPGRRKGEPLAADLTVGGAVGTERAAFPRAGTSQPRVRSTEAQRHSRPHTNACGQQGEAGSSSLGAQHSRPRSAHHPSTPGRAGSLQRQQVQVRGASDKGACLGEESREGGG